MNTEAIVAVATLALGLSSGLVAVVFFIGRLSSRVDRLEEWRSEVRDMHRENIARFDRLDRELRGHRNSRLEDLDNE
jgi:hypothetical protein